MGELARALEVTIDAAMREATVQRHTESVDDSTRRQPTPNRPAVASSGHSAILTSVAAPSCRAGKPACCGCLHILHVGGCPLAARLLKKVEVQH